MITFLLFAILTLSVCQAHDYNADGWKSASGFLRASMDPSKDPCRDFYGHACGRWVNRESREGSDELRDAETKLRDLFLRSLEKVELNSTESTPNYQKWLRVFYDQCMDISIMNETQLLVAEYRALESSYDYLANLTFHAGDKSRQSIIWFMAGYLEQNFLAHLFTETKVDWVWVNCTKKSILKLTPPLRPYLKMSQEVMAEKIQTLFTAVGTPLDLSEANVEAEFIKTFENELTELVDANYDDKSNEDGKMIKLAKLSEEYPGIEWDSFWAGLFPDHWEDLWNQSDPQVIFFY